MTNCIHEKVYSGEAFMTNPPKWAWICSQCLCFGFTLGKKCPAERQTKLYWQLMVKKDPTTEIPKLFR